jgi:hypothetical protein
MKEDIIRYRSRNKEKTKKYYKAKDRKKTDSGAYIDRM